MPLGRNCTKGSWAEHNSSRDLAHNTRQMELLGEFTENPRRRQQDTQGSENHRQIMSRQMLHRRGHPDRGLKRDGDCLSFLSSQISKDEVEEISHERMAETNTGHREKQRGSSVSSSKIAERSR